MKKIIVVLAVAVALCLPQIAAAYTVATVGGPSGFGPWQSGPGGEFTILPGGFSVNYAASTRNQEGGTSGTFQTFCIEHNEYIWPSTTVYASFNSGAILGGVGGAVEGFDALSIGTAYLYSKFAQGTLTGYNYTGDRLGSANLLQQAIWMLEGEQGVDSTNQFYTLAMSVLGLGVDQVRVDAAIGAYGVMVLNLSVPAGKQGQYGIYGQDQLVYVPEPATFLLFGLGMIGMAGVRRKLKR